MAILGGNDCILLLKTWGYPNEASKQIRRSDLSNMFTAVYYVGYWDSVPKYIFENPRVRYHEIDSDSLQTYITIIERLSETKTELLDYRQGLLEEGTSNWPSAGLFSGHTSLPPLAIAISTALYSGLHAAAWHSFFPTEVEKWVVIAASGLIFAYGMVSYRVYLHSRIQDLFPHFQLRSPT